MKVHLLILSIVAIAIGCTNRNSNLENANDSTSSFHTVHNSTTAIIKQEWLTAQCELLCDDEHGKFLDIKKLNKYKKWTPYDTVQKTNKDLVTISFDFITDCCLDFQGGATFNSDTLVLQYGLVSDTLRSCDCYCDYRMKYEIKRTKEWSVIRITNVNRG